MWSHSIKNSANFCFLCVWISEEEEERRRRRKRQQQQERKRRTGAWNWRVRARSERGSIKVNREKTKAGWLLWRDRGTGFTSNTPATNDTKPSFTLNTCTLATGVYSPTLQ